MNKQRKLLNSIYHNNVFYAKVLKNSINNFTLFKINIIKRLKTKDFYFSFHLLNFNIKKIISINFKYGIEIEIYKFLWFAIKFIRKSI